MIYKTLCCKSGKQTYYEIVATNHGFFPKEITREGQPVAEDLMFLLGRLHLCSLETVTRKDYLRALQEESWNL